MIGGSEDTKGNFVGIRGRFRVQLGSEGATERRPACGDYRVTFNRNGRLVL
jgi:hypothetical protein